MVHLKLLEDYTRVWIELIDRGVSVTRYYNYYGNIFDFMHL